MKDEAKAAVDFGNTMHPGRATFRCFVLESADNKTIKRFGPLTNRRRSHGTLPIRTTTGVRLMPPNNQAAMIKGAYTC